MRVVCGGLALCALALLSWHRSIVFQTNESVWQDARVTAPYKARPLVNLAVARIAEPDADSLLLGALVLSQAPHRRRWERMHTADLVAANRAIARLIQGDIQGAHRMVSIGMQLERHESTSLVCQRHGWCPQPEPR